MDLTKEELKILEERKEYMESIGLTIEDYKRNKAEQMVLWTTVYELTIGSTNEDDKIKVYTEKDYMSYVESLMVLTLKSGLPIVFTPAIKDYKVFKFYLEMKGLKSIRLVDLLIRLESNLDRNKNLTSEYSLTVNKILLHVYHADFFQVTGGVSGKILDIKDKNFKLRTDKWYFTLKSKLVSTGLHI